MNAEDTVEQVGIDLSNPEPPVANYVPAVNAGNMVYLSGKERSQSDGTMISGKVGSDLNIEQGYEAARLVGIQLLAALREHIGDLNRVSRVVKVLGMVNSTPDFEDHPKVINGCSDLLVSVFGENGKHARSEIGRASCRERVYISVVAVT